MSTATSTDAAWARVTILLNTGDVTAAEAAAVQAAAGTDWAALEDDKWCYGGPVIYAADLLPTGWCWYDPAEELLVLPPSVMAEFGMAGIIPNFAKGIAASVRCGPGFRRYSVQDWRELRRLR